MSEISMLKERIRRASYRGIRLDHIRDNYSPVGSSFISDLVASGDFVLGWSNDEGDVTTNIDTVKNYRSHDWKEVILLAAFK